LGNTKIKEGFMTQDDFLWLQKWYQTHCNGDWEHGSGIHLLTIDNPGWSLTINLEGTELENRVFQQIDRNQSEEDWIFCEIKNFKFEARCGINNLNRVLRIFRDWADL